MSAKPSASASVPPSPLSADGLGLLDATAELYEAALPGIEGDDVLFFGQLNALRQLLDRYFARVLKPYGLVYSEYRVLSVLRVREAGHRVTPLELNRFVQLTAAGLTRALDRLERAGYLRREPNPDDRRSVLVGLTDTGRAFAEKVIRDLAGGYGELLADFAAPDRDAITRELRRLIDRLHVHLSRPPERAD